MTSLLANLMFKNDFFSIKEKKEIANQFAILTNYSPNKIAQGMSENELESIPETSIGTLQKMLSKLINDLDKYK